MQMSASFSVQPIFLILKADMLDWVPVWNAFGTTYMSPESVNGMARDLGPFKLLFCKISFCFFNFKRSSARHSELVGQFLYIHWLNKRSQCVKELFPFLRSYLPLFCLLHFHCSDSNHRNNQHQTHWMSVPQEVRTLASSENTGIGLYQAAGNYV